MNTRSIRNFTTRSKAIFFSNNCRVQRCCKQVDLSGSGRATSTYSPFVLCRTRHCNYFNSTTRFFTHASNVLGDASFGTRKKRAHSNEAGFRLKSDGLQQNYDETQTMHTAKSIKTKQSHRKGQAKYTKPKYQPLRPPFSLFVTCLPGLEPLLLKEIEYLRTHQNNECTSSNKSPSTPRLIPGGVELTVPTLTHLYILCLYLGTASHIYIRLNGDEVRKEGDESLCAQIPSLFRARGFPELERKLKDLIVAQDWSRWLGVSTKFSNRSNILSRVPPWNLQVHVTTSKSKLIHTKAVEGRVRKTVGEVLGLDLDNNDPRKESLLEEKPTIRILVRIERDAVQVSLDATSVPLHMRGYRKNPHKAPLREDLAFALCLAGGMSPSWNLLSLQALLGGSPSRTIEHATRPTVNLFDPCCGSGTIAIEGAAILAGLPPGRNRSVPLQGTLFCNDGLWKDIKFKALSLSTMDNNTVSANDIDAAAIHAAKLNAEEGGVLKFIDFTTGCFQKQGLLAQAPLKSTASTMTIVTNPPFGHRLSSSAVYKKLAQSISTLILQRKNIRFAMIGNDPRPMRETGLPLEVSFSSKSGGLNVVAMAMTRDD
ncbi:hypothetical protein ACHAW6_012102 [Cyclotella cf. meneghiniana]